jgi:hypothetical protein
LKCAVSQHGGTPGSRSQDPFVQPAFGENHSEPGAVCGVIVPPFRIQPCPSGPDRTPVSANRNAAHSFLICSRVSQRIERSRGAIFRRSLNSPDRFHHLPADTSRPDLDDAALIYPFHPVVCIIIQSIPDVQCISLESLGGF